MMKRISLRILIATCLMLGSFSVLTAQEQVTKVDRTKYPDYTETTNPDWSLMTPVRSTRAVAQRPDHVNNGASRHFPPVFNQDGGSCGSASRICYMFSHELAAYRNLDGSDPNNYYPSHFVWLHTNSPGQGKNEFVTQVGVPSAATYGGQTYSELFGWQDEGYKDFGWMQGYDKWYEAMHNRMLEPSNFPMHLGTEEGREAVKNWLWNHNGDDSFAAGGICGIGVASGGLWEPIPSTEANKEIGVAGMYYVKEWGTGVDHALTIVGYDDRIEFDLNGNGKYGEAEADERGAWIIVNSWGNWWCNSGFIYCPYAFAGATFNDNGPQGYRTFSGNWWAPEIYRVRKDYRPLRTIKLEMAYSRRSEIALSAGISRDLTAEEPEKRISFIHFTYAGDGNGGNSNPAPEVPMLGRWADGELHTEPMEFGYDLTDLSNEFDMTQPLKYFFIIDSRSWAQGEGNIIKASIIDYCTSELGIETPFAVGEGITVKNAGEKTIISVIVQGTGYPKPQNVAYTNGTLTWQAPLTAGQEVSGYSIDHNGAPVASVDANTYSYTLEETSPLSDYAVKALYADGGKSEGVEVRTPLPTTEDNVGIHYDHAGFTIPDVMKTRHEQATIEFWLKPSSLAYWNQSGGGGSGSFYFYALGHGQYSAGWDWYDDNSVANTYNAPLKVNQWSHIAIVVNKNNLKLYVNGLRLGSCETNSYSGVGGFGDLIFSSNDRIAPNGAQHGVYDEVRVWDVARTEQEIKECMYTEFTGSVMPKGLIAYLRGDIITDEEGNQRLFDYAGGHHATLQGNYSVVSTDELGLTIASQEPTISIDEPKGTIYAGIPVTLTATYNNAVNRIAWTAEGAGMKDMTVASPTMTFATAGTYPVTVTAYTADERTVTATRNITVAEAPEVDATFTATAQEVPAGERITFHVTNPQAGCLYKWSMPGATIQQGSSHSVVTTYEAQGTYTVTLTATAPNGKSSTKSMKIDVIGVTPKPDFELTPTLLLKGEEMTIIDRSHYAPTQWEWTITNGKVTYTVHGKGATFAIDYPGMYDVTLEATNEIGTGIITRKNAIVVANADSENGLHFSSDAAMVTTTTPPIGNNKQVTIEWWMNPEWPTTYCNGIGESEGTFIIKTNAEGQLRAYINGEYVATPNGQVIPGEWHHYAVTYSGNAGIVNFFRDGTHISGGNVSTTTMPKLTAFTIGGAQAPFKGGIDELRIWKRSLNLNQLKEYANTPIEKVDSLERVRSLVLYYDFNQNGGDVQDRTSNANHGIRTGFGPDGDAWGLSRGVFSLNLGTDEEKEIVIDNITPITSDNEGAQAAMKGIYDLMGRQLRTSNQTQGLAPGLYIIDGRKRAIK